MVQRALGFDPKILLSAPRRSSGVPNASGTRVLYTTSTYSFDTHSKTSELRVLDIASGDSHELARDDDLSDLNWLDDDHFACLQAEKDGSTSLFVAGVDAVTRAPQSGPTYYVAGKIDGGAANLRIRRLDCDHYAVVVSAQATPSGNLFNAEKARKTHSTGRVYDGLFTRHWDQWTPKEKNSLWYGKLVRTESGQFRLSGLTNALHRTGLECPIRPFGGIDHFDLSDSAIIFVSKDPKLNPALNTKANVYLLEVGDWAGQQAAEPRQILVPSFEGAATSPTFSPDGSKAAFLMMQRGGYEADQNDIFVVNVIHARPSAGEMTVMGTSPKDWDRSPGSVCWTADGRDLLVTAEEHGTGKLFLIDGRGGKQPRALTKHGSIGDVRPLPDGRVFASGSSLVDNMFYLIIEPSAPSSPITWTNSHSSEGGKFGLKPSQISSIWTPASNPHVNPEIHSIVVRPSHHDATRKYPVAYLIHGGPQGAWADNWSTRWNPMVFAEQGYIVIAPNPTGSTGYGQAFTDAIRHNWGGDPYHDIVNVFDWASRHMPDADHSRAVALGASYGGYMMNWIQGHDLGRKFQCLVCHDGITSFAGGLLGTDELYFPFYDLGLPWSSSSAHHSLSDDGVDEPSSSSAPAQTRRNFGPASLADWRKWDPSEHFAQWSTPQLVIHSSKDYRLPIAEGLAAFNILRARGVEAKFLTFPDENHWVLKPENSLVWHKVVLNWIHRFVGLPPYTMEDEESEEFFGGWRGEREEEELVEMEGQGKVEI